MTNDHLAYLYVNKRLLTIIENYRKELQRLYETENFYVFNERLDFYTAELSFVRDYIYTRNITEGLVKLANLKNISLELEELDREYEKNKRLKFRLLMHLTVFVLFCVIVFKQKFAMIDD